MRCERVGGCGQWRGGPGEAKDGGENRRQWVERMPVSVVWCRVCRVVLLERGGCRTRMAPGAEKAGLAASKRNRMDWKVSSQGGGSNGHVTAAVGDSAKWTVTMKAAVRGREAYGANHSILDSGGNRRAEHCERAETPSPSSSGIAPHGRLFENRKFPWG